MENQIDARTADLEDPALATTPERRGREYERTSPAALSTSFGVAALVGTAAPAFAEAPVHLSQPFSYCVPI